MEKGYHKNQYYVPLAIITCSSVLFVGLTFAFGVTVDSRTGQTEYQLMTDMRDSGEYLDPWIYDPAVIVWGDFWRYYAMAGYFACIAVFTYCWFEFKKDKGYWSSEEELK